MVLAIGTQVSVAVNKALPRVGWTPKTLARVHLPIKFVPPDEALYRQCRATAKAVGYAVPCPSLVPYGLSGTAIAAGPCRGYRFRLVGQPCRAAGSAWSGWVVGSVQGGAGTSFEHLVIQVSPHPVDYRHAVDGPLPASSTGPDVGTPISVAGRVMRWLFVDPNSDVGSAFMGHVVLDWTAGGHTYAFGFHAIQGLRIAAALDYALARHLQLVSPN
jgi:hypothetical protein